jgi:hypothetical protein
VKEFEVVGLDSPALFLLKKSLINIVENLNTNPEVVLAHRKGLQQIVKMKGGLDQLGFNGLLAQKIIM